MDDLLPKMQQLLSEANSDKQCQTSPNFLQVLQQNLVPAQTFTQSFLKTVLLALDTSDTELSTIWLNMLLEAIAILPAQTVCCEILPTAINKSQISEPLNKRIIACRILGKMCSTFSLEMLRREAVPTVIALCQDVLWEVRAHICDELGAAGPLVAESNLLLMSLVDLTNDENCKVRAAAVNTVSGVIEHLQPEVMISVIAPLVLKLCKESDLEVLQAISKKIGKLCICLQDHIPESEKQRLFSFYQMLTQIGLLNTPKSTTVLCENFTPMETLYMPDIIQQHQEIREQAALNFPLVMESFVGKLKGGSNDWFQSFYGIFRALTVDPQYTIRVIVAKIFIQVLQIFGPAYYSLIETDFIKLLSDKRIDVLKSLVPHLAQILLKITEEQKELPRQEEISGISQSLLLCENSLYDQLDWRIYCTFLEQLEVLPLCYTSDFIYNYFLDHLMKRVTTVRQLPCRLAILHIILVLLRYNISDKHCSDIRDKLYERLLICGNSYLRMSYLHLCSKALEIFSRKYFKDYFFCNAMQLGDDRIANVRLSVAKLLPKLKTLLVLPADHDKLLQIQFLLTRLLNDTDRDVRSCAQDANKQIETNKFQHISNDAEDKFLEQEEEKLKTSNHEKLFNILSNDLRYKKFRITENHHYKNLPGSHGIKAVGEKSFTYSSIGEHDFIVDTGVCITSIPSRIPSPKPVAPKKYRSCEMKVFAQKEKRNLVGKETKCETQLKERRNVVKCLATSKSTKCLSNKSSSPQESFGSNENVNVNTHFSIMDVKNGNIHLGDSQQSTQMHVINPLNFIDKPNNIVKNNESIENSTSLSGCYKKESCILKEQTVPMTENPKNKLDSTFLRSSMKKLNLLDDKKVNTNSKSKNTNNLSTMLQNNNDSQIVFRKTSNYKKKRNSFVGDFVNAGVGIPKKNIDYARKRFSLVETPVPIDLSDKSNHEEISDLACGKSNSPIQYEKRNSIPKRMSLYVSKKSFNDGKIVEPNLRKVNNIILQGDRQVSKKQISEEQSKERESKINESIADSKVIDTHLDVTVKSNELKFSDDKSSDASLHINNNDIQALQVSKRPRKTNDIKIMSENEQVSKKRYFRNSALLSTCNGEVSKQPNSSGKSDSKSLGKLAEIATSQSNKKRQSFIECSQITKSESIKSQTESKHRRHSSLERPKTIKPPPSQSPNSKLPVLRRQIHPT